MPNLCEAAGNESSAKSHTKSPVKSRVGLYGGAFDPPHLAHIALAQAAVEQLGLDVLYIIPTGQPWMKQRRLTAAVHRLAMAQLAFAHLPRVQVDDCELRRSGITYTIDTLRELQARPAHASQPTDWFLIMGEDLLHTLPQWQRAEDLLREVTAAVLPRAVEQKKDQADLPADASTGVGLGAVSAVSAAANEASLQPQQTLHEPAGVRAVPLHLPASTAQAVSGISATRIRNGLQAREALAPQERLAWLQSLVPPAVAQYIEAHQLYLTPQAPTPHAN